MKNILFILSMMLIAGLTSCSNTGNKDSENQATENKAAEDKESGDAFKYEVDKFADLFALYYIMDPKMVDLGLLPNKEAQKAAYIDYIQNGLMTQLTRIEPGKDIEQVHMRNRQLISKWAYEHGKKENVIEKIVKNGKTYFKINDFEALRHLFGELLKEVQRIKSEGDYEAGKSLVENYGVKIDYALHKEVRERYAKLNLAPYSGFINPVYKAIEKNGGIVDIQISYPDNYAEQMLYYSENYSFLPSYN